MVDEIGQFLFIHQFVDDIKIQLTRNDLEENHSTRRGFLDLSIYAHFDPRMQINGSRIECAADFFRAGKNHALAFDIFFSASQLVNPQNDILAGNDDRFSVGRRQDIIGGHHQHARLGLSLNG